MAKPRAVAERVPLRASAEPYERCSDIRRGRTAAYPRQCANRPAGQLRLRALPPDSVLAYGGRQVRVAQLIAGRGVRVRATAFGAASAPRAPRARAGARSDRTLATRAAPRSPPYRRPQSATEALCGVCPHPSSPASSSPLRRRVRTGVLTTLATRAYRRRPARCASSCALDIGRTSGSGAWVRVPGVGKVGVAPPAQAGRAR
jgi:hypothetical protein